MIKIGPPLVVKVDVQQAGPGTVSVSPVLVGCAGEEYLPGRKQGWKRPPPPALKIVDEKGTILVANNFQYG